MEQLFRGRNPGMPESIVSCRRFSEGRVVRGSQASSNLLDSQIPATAKSTARVVYGPIRISAVFNRFDSFGVKSFPLM